MEALVDAEKKSNRLLKALATKKRHADRLNTLFRSHPPALLLVPRAQSITYIDLVDDFVDSHIALRNPTRTDQYITPNGLCGLYRAVNKDTMHVYVGTPDSSSRYDTFDPPRFASVGLRPTAEFRVVGEFTVDVNGTLLQCALINTPVTYPGCLWGPGSSRNAYHSPSSSPETRRRAPPPPPPSRSPMTRQVSSTSAIAVPKSPPIAPSGTRTNDNTPPIATSISPSTPGGSFTDSLATDPGPPATASTTHAQLVEPANSSVVQHVASPAVAPPVVPTSTFADFLDKMRKPAAYPLYKSIKQQITATQRACGERTVDMEQVARVVREFLDACGNSMARHPLWLGVGEGDFDRAREGLEKYVMTKLYPTVFAAPGSGDQITDESLQRRIKQLHFVTPPLLEVEAHIFDSPTFATAQRELRKLAQYKTPRDKLLCVLNCTKIVISMIEEANVEASADSFLPALIYTTLKANPPQLRSHLEYIRRFRHPDRLCTGEQAFAFMNLDCAVSFIVQLDAAKLNLDDEEFQQQMHRRPSRAAFVKRNRVDDPRVSSVHGVDAVLAEAVAASSSLSLAAEGEHSAPTLATDASASTADTLPLSTAASESSSAPSTLPGVDAAIAGSAVASADHNLAVIASPGRPTDTTVHPAIRGSFVLDGPVGSSSAVFDDLDDVDDANDAEDGDRPADDARSSSSTHSSESQSAPVNTSRAVFDNDSVSIEERFLTCQVGALTLDDVGVLLREYRRLAAHFSSRPPF